MDITERKRAEEERERLRQAHEDLARVNRVTTMGELTASLAHEVNQPIAGAITNANACLRWLAGDAPNLEEAARSCQENREGRNAGGGNHQPDPFALQEGYPRNGSWSMSTKSFER